MRKKVKTEASSAAAAGGGKESNGDEMDVDGAVGGGSALVKEEINGDDDGSMVFTSTTEFTSRLEVRAIISYHVYITHEKAATQYPSTWLVFGACLCV